MARKRTTKRSRPAKRNPRAMSLMFNNEGPFRFVRGEVGIAHLALTGGCVATGEIKLADGKVHEAILRLDARRRAINAYVITPLGLYRDMRDPWWKTDPMMSGLSKRSVKSWAWRLSRQVKWRKPSEATHCPSKALPVISADQSRVIPMPAPVARKRRRRRAS